MPEDVLVEIVARTDGIPLFVEELTKTVLESGLLQDAGDHFELAGPLPPRAIPARPGFADGPPRPPRVGQGSRSDRRRDRPRVRSPAARGGFFVFRERVERCSRQLVAAELIFRRGAPPDAIYTFKHALVQDAAYGGLLKSRRQQSTLESRGRWSRFPEVVANRPEVLAHHLTDAGLLSGPSVLA